MATADQLKALVRSHASGDEKQFYSVALQVAARAARGGQSRFAQELRDLIDEAKARSANGSERALRPVPVAQPRGELAGLLAVSYPDVHLAYLTVDEGVRDRIQRVLTEQRQAEQLLQHGYRPLQSLLLVGPPGTGKTMTAQVLATELRLPLFLIRLEVLITKFMGETAAKLRMVFDAVESTRGVYLFDEVDALAGDRASGNDVGEIRRVLNSFLQFLDSHHSTSLIVAATNHPRLLDRAIYRRFDTVVEYPLPTPDVARDVIRQRLAGLDTKGLVWARIDEAASGLSHAELTLACEQAAKDAILSGRTRITTAALVATLSERHRTVG
jgi:SpoVK/Ycf46/Vps4 family AAA+-type ATPase